VNDSDRNLENQSEASLRGNYFQNTRYFDNIDQNCRFHVDNEGKVIFINTEHKLMMVNDRQLWDEFDKNISKTKKHLDEIQLMTFGQGTIAMIIESSLYWFTYSESGFSKPKLLNHNVLSNIDQKLIHIILPMSSNHVILIYELQQVIIIIWDVDKDREHAYFQARQGDVLTDYLSSNKAMIKDSNPKKHMFGFACFVQYQNEESPSRDISSHYILDLDTNMPNPFIKVETKTPEYKWGQGTRMDSQGEKVLNGGS